MAKMPPPPSIPKSGKPAGETIAGSPDHTTLAAALKAAGLGTQPNLTYLSTYILLQPLSDTDKVLNESPKGPYSYAVVGPTDAAFKKLPAGTVEALLKDIPKLTSILKFHVSTTQASQLPTRNGRAYETLCADSDGDFKEIGVRVTVDTCESFLMGGQPNKAKVTGTIQTTNGYVFVTDEVLLPYDGKKPPYMDIKEEIPEGYVTP